MHKPELVHDDINPSYNIENEINNYRNQLKSRNIEDINNKLYQYQDGVYYMDMVSESEKLGDYVLNVVQAVIEKKIKRIFVLNNINSPFPLLREGLFLIYIHYEL